MMPTENSPTNGVGQLSVGSPLASTYHLLEEAGWNLADVHSKAILHLGRDDRDRDTAGESGGDRMRDVLDQRSQAGGSKNKEENSRHCGADEQIRHAVVNDNHVDQSDESAGRASDLNLGAT